jgi:DNA-binding transcriptional LysR family regulator
LVNNRVAGHSREATLQLFHCFRCLISFAMFIRQLGYLVALAREKHFAKAAEVCHVSQPALSAAIRSLEKELGIMIVQRGRRFLGLTLEGERVLAWAQQTLASLSHMRADRCDSDYHDSSSALDRAVPRSLPKHTLHDVLSERRGHHQSIGPLRT